MIGATTSAVVVVTASTVVSVVDGSTGVTGAGWVVGGVVAVVTVIGTVV